MGGDYFGLDRIVSIILAIIPFTAWLFGMLTRCKEQKYLAAIIRFFLGWIIWIIDLIMCIGNGCNVNILRVIDC